MAAQKKTSSVSKKISPQEALNSQRWIAFTKAHSIPYGELSNEWNLFFDVALNYESSTADIEKAIDAAIQADAVASVIK